MTVLGHFSPAYIGYAAQQGVPAAGLLVPLSGVIATLGGLSVTLGYKAKLGAWLLVLFLVPVTLMMHNFWAVTDPMMRGMQIALFMKNVSMLGAALLITHFGSGPLSLDARASSPLAYASAPRAAALHVPGHDPHELGIGPRLPAVRFHGTSVGQLRLGGGPRACEELVEPVHGEVQVERVHVAGEDVDLAPELGPERCPVPLQISAQVVVVRPEVLGHAAVDRARAQVPQLGRVAVRRHRTVGRFPDRELLARAGAAAEHRLEFAPRPDAAARLAGALPSRRHVRGQPFP